MYQQLNNKEKKLAVIGLGYVGLPIALEFARKISVVGFDINNSRLELMKNGIDPSNELESKDFENTDILFTSDLEDLRDATFFIVAVPTPIDEYKVPNLRPLFAASTTVGIVLKQGDYVVFESTVYPGCTEDDCIPILEKKSGLRFKTDFKAGYSPERINPGDTEHTLTKIIKVVSGCDEESLQLIAKVYEMVVEAGVFKAASIKVAEAAKVIENTQRDLNIALMNELAKIFYRSGINTLDVLEAAGTKWNFLKFYPGLVGGHCIGVDPYYLTYKAAGLGYQSEVILSGRRINDSMGAFVARRLVRDIITAGKRVANSKVLVMGITFKENVTDIRNSKVVDVIRELSSFSVNVDVADPYADSEEVEHEYGFKLVPEIRNDYDAVIVALNHSEFMELDETYFKGITCASAIIVDIKGIYRGKIKKLTYWSL
ncbi:MAG TPA: nucleotide sugar dehydrogenase [Flavobacteriales bacterium]|nr:nucleotide sugar dehydrogenase [Flavobacteriales bacterium]